MIGNENYDKYKLNLAKPCYFRLFCISLTKTSMQKEMKNHTHIKMFSTTIDH